MSYLDIKCHNGIFMKIMYFNTVMFCIQLFMTKSLMYLLHYLNYTTSALVANLKFCFLHALMRKAFLIQKLLSGHSYPKLS